MVDTNKPLDEASARTSIVVGVLTAVTLTAVAVVVGAAVSLAQPEANASPIALPPTHCLRLRPRLRGA